ncbi:MAG: MBL fold metallo-hydrolase [Candidatus Eremiobacteraeota bacterium]|nr:MBL fold metallo-hydrolase [Candidatus Eremiobacteraeota bacterium]
MIVRVLGSAAGGGVPQWNCACVHCSAARSGTRPRRSQSGFAFSSDGDRWWLLNASPDIAQQIEAYAPLQPRDSRGTPIAGMLFTDANVDHLGGLAVLRQAGAHAFELHSSATVRALAADQPAFATFTAPPHRWSALAPGDVVDLSCGLSARVVALDGLTPGFAGRQSLPDAVVGYLVSDAATGGSVFFAPVFADVSATLLEAAAKADVAFFDGSFWSDDELQGFGVEKAARALGHAPVGGLHGSLAALATLRPKARRLYVHVNNTNPLLDPASAPAREIAAYGFELASDGLDLRV